jgi:two-component system cell cycle response regulator DivK
MPTALIIDDNELNLESLRVLLKKEGVEALTLLSPHNVAAELANAGDIQVVFLDLEFPNGDGIQYVGDLRSIPQLAISPILAYSVHISELNEVRAAGFDGFIGKPLNSQKFPDQLRRIFAGEAVWDTGQ